MTERALVGTGLAVVASLPTLALIEGLANGSVLDWAAALFAWGISGLILRDVLFGNEYTPYQ